MKTTTFLRTLLTAALVSAAGGAMAQSMNITRSGDTTIVNITNPPRYLILPIEEEKNEVQVKLDNGRADDTWMDVRLAVDKTDYSVPFKLGTGRTATVRIVGLPATAVALKQLRLSNDFSTVNTDYYRPLYHHTPEYGWMNDPNGMFYKDGVYHLYYQYNPYGSKWGNMHWGHSVSPDMVHWVHLDPAIPRDTLGHIFSGSSVVDYNGDAGYGKGTVISFYTSHKEVPQPDGTKRQRQFQCMAYSVDGGRTFTTYPGNPVLVPFDGLKDFRDPKVFWYEPAKAWYMIVSADKNMRFYKSTNLKNWTYISEFGKGWGAQPNQFECPDFFPLTIDGKQKWVMIVNINPGCLFGGSATEYFVGDFDGTRFKPDTKPSVAKFLDYGKDHYATVTFSNTGSRVLAIAWVSNWQYANLTPIRQYRGQNSLPRELKLFRAGGDLYVSANVADEARSLRQQTRTLGDYTVTADTRIANLFPNNDGAFEIEADVTPDKNGLAGLDLVNGKGERVKIYIDVKAGRIVMDRTESGITKFGERAVPHQIELDYDSHEHRELSTPVRKAHAINYKNDFALGTWAPLSLCASKTYHLNIFVDKCSIEMFVDGGRIAMTNLVFPTEPYNDLVLTGKGTVKNLKVYKLALGR